MSVRIPWTQTTRGRDVRSVIDLLCALKDGSPAGSVGFPGFGQMPLRLTSHVVSPFVKFSASCKDTACVSSVTQQRGPDQMRGSA